MPELVGRGGMGTVWRATDELLERQVAVKQVDLPVTVSGNERAAVRARVFREARAAARLNHTATAALYDVLEDDGTLFLVMEPAHPAPVPVEPDWRWGPHCRPVSSSAPWSC